METSNSSGLARWFVALGLTGCSCGPPPGTDASTTDADVDAQYCEREIEIRDEDFGEFGSVHWIGDTNPAGGLPVAYGDRYVYAVVLDGPLVRRVWDIRRREDTGGILRWEGNSVVGVLARRENPENIAPYHDYMLWRPSLSSETTIELPLYERWPYSTIGACGVDVGEVLPTPTRLWLARGVTCSEDPERDSGLFGRLHGFAVDGTDVTPEEGIPLSQVFWTSALSSTFQPHPDDGLSYVSMDRGDDGTEDEALHWVRRGPDAAVVGRSPAIASAAEMRGSENVWLRPDGEAALFYAHLPTGPASIFARFEGDGRIAWLHRCEGLVANDGATRSRVEKLDGGIVALLSRADRSTRSVVQIDREGTIVIAPGSLRLGDEPLRNVAFATDRWGVTTIVAATVEDIPLVLRRYDWSGRLAWENVLEDTRSAGLPQLRSDRSGGVYLLTYPSPLYQHFDQWGRPGLFDRIVSCPPRAQEFQTMLADRPPIDAGMDAAVIPDVGRDAWRSFDATDVDAWDGEKP